MRKQVVVIVLEALCVLLVALGGYQIWPALGVILLGLGCGLFAQSIDRDE